MHDGQTPAQRRVAERLIEIGRNPFRAALENGLPRTFMYEFLTGKKRSFRYEERDKFAAGLNWTTNELDVVLKEGVGKIGSDPVDRGVAEAAFSGLMRNLRPDIEDLPGLVELFRDLVQTGAESQSDVPLIDQMFLRAQLPARRFAAKWQSTDSPTPRPHS
jgi:hypothetical protein